MDVRDRIVELRRVKASELHANPKNWRIHPQSQRNALAGVLAEIGYADALLVRQTPAGLELIDGHLRAETTPEMEVPVLVLDVDAAEADMILATHDPLASMAEMDSERLRDLLGGLEAHDDALRTMLEEIRVGLDPEPVVVEDPGTQIDQAEELREKWGVERGQVWQVGRHRVMCGDATDAGDVGRLLKGRCQCVFTSPPYAVGVDYGPTYRDDVAHLRALLSSVAPLWLEVVEAGGFAVVNFGDVAPASDITEETEPCEYPMALEHWPVFRQAGWRLWARRVWCKPNPRVHAPWTIQTNRAATDWEHVWTWKAPGPAIVARGGDSPRGWIDTTHDQGVDVGKEIHGAGMAVGAAKWLIGIHTSSGGAVHEPFLGSGTTLVACEQLGRVGYGMEISPGYVAVTLERLAGMGLGTELA